MERTGTSTIHLRMWGKDEPYEQVLVLTTENDDYPFLRVETQRSRDWLVSLVSLVALVERTWFLSQSKSMI